MSGALQVVIVCDKTDTTGTFKDASELAKKFPAAGRQVGQRIAPVKILDGREPPAVCDICIHMETPQPVWFAWARTNCILVNMSTWKHDAWNGYLDTFDVAMFYNHVSLQSFITQEGPQPRESVVLQSEDNTVLGEVINTCVAAFEYREAIPKHMPPLLNIQDCPSISVITLVHNRPKFIENACLNLLSSDYPREKIEWVVVDDSDPDQSPSNRILQFAEMFAPGIVTYVPLVKKRTVGFKRNLGVEKAKHDILVMMDDDDHYPSTSFRRRVAYLRNGRRSYSCATCTSIAMYDLLKGTSAVNVPPYTLPLSKRCSEASMVFTRDFWLHRKFPDTSQAEGEGFLEGRESQVVEMPPQQLIVALSHGSNLSGRSMPDAKPSCFWGFPRPLLEFLHGLVGVKVEAE